MLIRRNLFVRAYRFAVMTGEQRVLGLIAIVTMFVAFISPANAADMNAVWDGTSGKWNDPTKWSSNPSFPNNGNGGFIYDATISAGSINLNQDVAIENISITGGLISSASGKIIAVSGTSNSWTAGSLSNMNLNVATTGSLSISGSGQKGLSGAIIAVGGVATYSGTGGLYTTAINSKINVLPSGTFEIQKDLALGILTGGYGANGAFNIQGTLRQSGSVAETTIGTGWYFNVTGTLDIQSGNFIIAPYSSSISGNLKIASGCQIDLAGSNSNVINYLTGATIQNNGVINVKSKIQFDTPATLPGTVAFLNSGTLHAGAPVNMTGNVTMSPGSNMYAISQITADSLAWNGGNIYNSAGVFIPTNGSISITPGDSSSTGIGNSSLLRIAGNATLNDGVVGGGISGSGGSKLQIDSTGVFDITGVTGFKSAGGSSTIQNSGTLKKTTNSGTATIVSAWTLNNTGTLQVQTGTLAIDGPVTQVFGSSLTGGTWIVSNNTTLALGAAANITTINPGATVILSGQNATFAKLDTLTENHGVFQIDSGKNFTIVPQFINNGTLNVGSGSLMTLSDTAHSAGQGLINIGPGGSTLADNLRTNSLVVDGLATIRANGGTAGASKVETLSIGAAGKLNLKDNDLVVGTAANVAAVRAAIKNGVAGSIGITSDLPAFGASTGFGYALGNDAAVSSLLAGSLADQTYDADSVLVKYTYLGDADLDGDSDLNDLGLWAQSFTGDLGNPAIPATFWTSGDFDYDGDTDLNDLGFWASTFSGDLGGGAGSLIVVAPNAPSGAVAALNSMGITVVPEPSVFLTGSAAIAFLAFAIRRKSSNCKQHPVVIRRERIEYLRL